MTEVTFVTTGNERQRAQFHLLPVSFVTIRLTPRQIYAFACVIVFMVQHSRALETGTLISCTALCD